MHFSCRPFIGQPSPSDWSQYWENEPDNPSLASKFGHLFGLIHLSSTEESDLSSSGRQIINDLTAKYFGSFQNDIPTALTQALTSVADTDTALAVILGNRLYLAAIGQIDIFLHRQNQISHLVSASPNASTISGNISDADNLLLTTHNFFRQISLEKINSSLSAPTLQSIEENFLSHLYSLTDQTAASAALIQIHFDELDTFSSPSFSPPPPPPVPKKSLFPRRPLFLPAPNLSREIIHRRHFRVIFSLILILALIISSLIGYRQNQRRQLETKHQQLLTNLDQTINDALAVKNLNLDNSQQLARQAKTILDELLSLKIHSEVLDPYSAKINSILSQTGSVDNQIHQDFYDTSVITDNPAYTKIFIQNSVLYLLDPVNSRIDTVILPGKSTKNISVSDSVKNSLDFSQNQNDVFFLKDNALYQNNSSLPVLDLSKSKPEIKVINFSFWNGSLYLLDNQTIWKLSPNSTGFGSPNQWLSSNQPFPQTPVSITINGNVWLLSSDGKIFSYLRGQSEEFKTQNIYQASRASSLTTTADGDLLAYIADDNFIYLYQKNGEIRAKYNLSPLKIIDLAFSSDQKILYFLAANQKIYQIVL